MQTLSVFKNERLRYVRYQNSSKTEIKTILLCLYGIEHSLRLVNDIRILASYPHFSLISAFYPHIRILPSYPHFTLISAFYPHIRILPSYPHFTLISAFYPHIRILPSYPSVRPHPRFTLTLHGRLQMVVTRPLH